MSNLGFLDKKQNRIDQARAHYHEGLPLLQKLSQVDRRYAGEVAKSKRAWGNWIKNVNSH